MGKERSLVLLDGSANLAAVEKRAHACEVRLRVDRQAVSVGVDPASEQLPQPRHLDPGGAWLTPISIQVRGELLARHATAPR